MRFKRLSDISMQADQLTRLTKEKGEKREITPLHRKISKTGPTTEQLVNKLSAQNRQCLTLLHLKMDEMKLTGSSADGWMLY